MTFPSITAFYAALLGLIFAALSSWVIAGRFEYKTRLGDGGKDAMTRRIRVHANFVEYVPLTLILVGLLETGGGSPTLVRILLVVLLVSRVMHPVGMFARENTPQHFIFRAGGIIATLIVMIVAAVALLLRSS